MSKLPELINSKNYKAVLKPYKKEKNEDLKKKAEGIQIMDLFFLKIYYPLLIQQKSKIKKIWVYYNKLTFITKSCFHFYLNLNLFRSF